MDGSTPPKIVPFGWKLFACLAGGFLADEEFAVCNRVGVF